MFLPARTPEPVPIRHPERKEEMAEVHELAESLGRELGRTPEYRTLARAIESTEEDREIAALRNEVEELQKAIQAVTDEGQAPPEAEMERLEAVIGRLQASSVYQSLVAAQANFDRIMYRVDAAMQEGMSKGAESRIILTP